METKTTSSNNVIEALSQLEDAVRNALGSARSYLNRTFKIIEGENNAKSGGWTQFLNETDKHPSSTGTAHGILALLACGEPVNSETAVLAIRYLESCQCNDGGWTKPSLHNKCSLTRITGLSLRAFLDSKSHQSSPTIKKGIDWLINSQNTDGGWGNTAKDEQSDVTSTSFALQVLTRIIGLSQNERNGIQRGQAWLLKARNADHSWGHTTNNQGTVAQTSEAIDGLLACGHSVASLKETTLWLEQHIETGGQFSERYLIPAGPSAKESVMWTQVSKERGLITLLALNSGLTSPQVVNAVKDILSRQVTGAHWKAEAFQNSEPIWAIKEAVVALRAFLNRVENNRASVVLSEEIINLRQELGAAQKQIQELQDRETKRAWKNKIKNLWVKTPKLSAGLLIGTILLTVVYVVFRHYKHQPEYADYMVAVASFVGLGFSIYPVIRENTRGGKK
jgi:hypothetical protein